MCGLEGYCCFGAVRCRVHEGEEVSVVVFGDGLCVSGSDVASTYYSYVELGRRGC